MAEEEVVGLAASPLPSDNKRKLEDLEPTYSESAEKPAETKEEADADNDVAESDLVESKRPRLDDSNPDGLAVENGFQGDKLEEAMKEEQDDEKLEEPVKEQDGEEAVKPNEASEQAENGEHQSEEAEAEATVKNEQLEGTIEKIEQSSADNHETGVEEQVKAGNSEAVIAQEPTKDENTQPYPEGSQQEIDDGSTISRKIEVPNTKVGVLIGKAGETIRSLQYNSGAKIQIMKDADADRDAPTRPVEIVGTLSSIIKAEKLINAVIEEADAGGSPSLVARGLATTQAAGAIEQIEIQVPYEKVGLIIGRGGDTIKGLQTRSGARIQLLQHLPEGEQSKERTVRVTGDKKQIEMAREMIKEVMNQTVRPSSHSGGFNQQSYRPRGPMGPSQWGPRSHHVQSMPFDYQQRGPYPSQNARYQAPNYGGYPQMAPRSNFGSSWDQRPHSMQGPPPQGGGYDYYGRQGASAPLSSSIPGHVPGPSPSPAMGPPPSQSSYNYGQPHGPDYAHPSYPQAGPQHSYGHGYEHKYGNHAAVQHPYGGHGASQAGYTQPGPQPGFAPQQPYGKPPSYGMPSQGHHPQTYGPPTSQPGEMAYPGPAASTQYGSNVPPQQQYPYASGGSAQQSYPPYGSAAPSDGYSQAPTATASGYPQPVGQPVPTYGQPAAQQAPGYAQVGAEGYGQYPSSQQGYTEQPAANSSAYGYQQDPSYAGVAGSTYSAPSSQPGYGQPATTQPGFDQNAPQSGGYGATAGVAPVPYAKTVSPQPGYPQYDSTQMYTAPR